MRRVSRNKKGKIYADSANEQSMLCSALMCAEPLYIQSGASPNTSM